ncbi:MAG: hypothetical protein BGO14_01580 [Chlamydiales bacterium 38-26]|nr:MAG: hypothetical protein BGO14_01580 [Chlamydiales bacterium 38-26]
MVELIIHLIFKSGFLSLKVKFLAKKNLFSLALMGVKTQNLLLWSVEQKSVEDSISALIRASDLYTLS